ncbi:Protein sickie [Strongyloides ratti]|uniref:Protein sickie n=1 Tax=Strongyloides ratti TaxID=34506 RepID=A0A090MPD1_STRRB|nr:Protein sickie [Strongyloides ratti]CEF59962.1 Protein sickie [Strongyloides ratti]
MQKNRNGSSHSRQMPVSQSTIPQPRIISHAHIVPISSNKNCFNLIKKEIKPVEDNKIHVPTVNIYSNRNVLSKVCISKISDDKIFKKEYKHNNNNVSSSIPSSLPIPKGSKKSNNEVMVQCNDNERKVFKNEITNRMDNVTQNGLKIGIGQLIRPMTSKHQFSIPKNNVITSTVKKEKEEILKPILTTSNKTSKNLSSNGTLNQQQTLIKFSKTSSTLLSTKNNPSGLNNTTKEGTALIKKTIPCNIKKPITKQPTKYLTSLKSPTISTFTLIETKGNYSNNILNRAREELSKTLSCKEKVEKVDDNIKMANKSSTINDSCLKNNKLTLNYDTGNKKRIENKSKDLNIVSFDNENSKLCDKICNENDNKKKENISSTTTNYDEVPNEKGIAFLEEKIIIDNISSNDIIKEEENINEIKLEDNTKCFYINQNSSKSPSPYSISQNTSTSPSTSSIEGIPYPNIIDKNKKFLLNKNDKEIFDENKEISQDHLNINNIFEVNKFEENNKCENIFENVQLPILKSPQIVARLRYEEANYCKINDSNDENWNYMKKKEEIKKNNETDKLVEKLCHDNRLNKRKNNKNNHHYVNFSTLNEYQNVINNKFILEDDSSSLSSDISDSRDIFSSDDLSDSSYTDCSQKPPISPRSNFSSNNKAYTKRHILTEKERMNELLMKSRTSQRSSAYSNYSSVIQNSTCNQQSRKSLDNNISSRNSSSLQLNYHCPPPILQVNYNLEHGYVNNLNQFQVDNYEKKCINECHSLDRVSCIKKKQSIEKDNQNQLHCINLVKNDVIEKNDNKGYGLMVMNSIKNRPASCISNRKNSNEGRYQTFSINENKNIYYDKEIIKGPLNCHGKFEFNYYNILDEELEQAILELEHLQFKMEPMDFRVKKIKEQLKRLQVYNSIVQKRKMMENNMNIKHSSHESLNSIKSKISFSSKESNAIKSKLSEIATTMKKTLKSNPSNPFKKAFKQKKSKLSNKKDGVESDNTFNETTNLKNNLIEKDKQLTEMRLEALNKANEVEELKETIKKLESENLSLKIHSTINSDRSSNGDFTLSSNHNSWNSGNSNSNNNSFSFNGIKFSETEYIKVFIVNDTSGTIHCNDEYSKTFIGYLKISKIGANWKAFDNNICEIFKKYNNIIDSKNILGLHHTSSILGYSIGLFKRNLNSISSPNNPSTICTPEKKINIFLKGDKQKSLDSLTFNTCISKNILKIFIDNIEKNKYILVNGDISIMKDNLIIQISNKLKETYGINFIIDGHDYDICRQKLLEEIDKIFNTISFKKKTILSLLHLRSDEFNYLSGKISKLNCKENCLIVLCCLEEGFTSNNQFTNDNNVFSTFNIDNNDDILKNIVQRNILNLQNPDDFLECLEDVTKYDNLICQNEKVIKFLVLIYKELLNFFSHLPSSKSHSLLLYKFLCPPSKEVRKMICWFSNLWNEKLVPYCRECISKAKYSPLTLSLIEEPLNIVGREWPWLNNTYQKNLLISIFQNQTNQNFYTNEIDSSFDPLAALIKIQNCNNESTKNFNEIDFDGNDKKMLF